MHVIEGRLDGAGLRIGVVCARFNDLITERLLAGARDGLVRHGVDDDAITVAWVPGSFEIPLVARTHGGLAAASTPSSAWARSSGAPPATTSRSPTSAPPASPGPALDTGVPVIFGVLTTDTIEQAIERAGTKAGNKGFEAALGAIESVRRARNSWADPPGPGTERPVLVASTAVLKLVLPKGSLERATLELFEAADLTVSRSSSVDYRATIDDPRIDDVRILRPQEIPTYVAEGLFDLGITGRDWIEETGADVVGLGELRYSKTTANPVAHRGGRARTSTPVASVADLPHGVRVSTEYPELTRRFFAERGIEADVRLSYGATEAKVPDIVDCVVDITETGRALRAAGLKIIDTILTSYTELVANPAAAADPSEGQGHGPAARRCSTGRMDARGRVLRQGQRGRRTPRRGDRRPAGHEVADGQRAVRRRGLRRRVGRAQVPDQHADPRSSRSWAPPTSSSCRSSRSCREPAATGRGGGPARSGRSASSTPRPAWAGRGRRRRAATRSTAWRSPTAAASIEVGHPGPLPGRGRPARSLGGRRHPPGARRPRSRLSRLGRPPGPVGDGQAGPGRRRRSAGVASVGGADEGQLDLAAGRAQRRPPASPRRPLQASSTAPSASMARRAAARFGLGPGPRWMAASS